MIGYGRAVFTEIYLEGPVNMTMIADGYLAIFTSHTYRKLINKTMMIDKNQVARTLLGTWPSWLSLVMDTLTQHTNMAMR